MIFVPLKYEYLEQMVEIEKEAFSTPWSKNMFIPEVESENSHYLVGLIGDEVICYGGFHSVLDEAHITNIAVKKEYRNNGYGNFLLVSLIDLAKSLDLKHMTLEVRTTNKIAIKLYESFGFKVEGLRKKYYNNTDDAYIMWLHF